MSTTPPVGMTEVTKEKFFADLYAETKSIMPSHVLPHVTIWQTWDRQVWGKSTPGWKLEGPSQKTRYFR